MQRQPPHAPAMGRQPTRGIERTEASEEFTRLRDGARGRWGQPREFRWVRSSPLSGVEEKRREIGIQNLGRTAKGKCLLLLFGPQPVADAWFKPAGPASPLIG